MSRGIHEQTGGARGIDRSPFGWYHAPAVTRAALSDVLLLISSLLVLYALVSRGLDSSWKGHLQTDCHTFSSRSDLFEKGASWREMKDNEYQPGALWFFAFVGVVKGSSNFTHGLMGVNAVLLLLHIIIARFGAGRGNAWAMLGAVAGVGPLLLFRFEPVVSVFLLSSVLLVNRVSGKMVGAGGVLLGAATVTKLYPVLSIPGLLIKSWRSFGAVGLVSSGAGFILGAGIPVLTFLQYGGEWRQIFKSFQYHFDKPVGVDGFWGSFFPVAQWFTGDPLKMASRNAIHGFDPVFALFPHWVPSLFTWAWIPLCAVVIWAGLSKRDSSLAFSPGLLFVVFGLFVALGKLSTPQYVWWALPLATLVPSGWFTDKEKVVLFLCLAGSLTLSQLIFPLNYSEFLSVFQRRTHLYSFLFWLNASKNLLWLAAVAIGSVALWRNFRIARP